MKNPNTMTIWERIQAPIPKFFKVLSWIGGFIVALTTPLLLANTSFFNTVLYLNAVGASMIAVSKFAVKSPQETEAEIKKDIETLKNN